MNNVDEVYDKLKTTGQNSVENIVQWLKDAQILELLHKSEEDARQLFDNLADKKNVTREQFKRVLQALGQEGCSLERIHQMLLRASERVFAAFNAAGRAFLHSLTNGEPSTTSFLRGLRLDKRFAI